MNLKRRGSSAGWMRRYTALYLLAAIPMAAILLASGKTFLWGGDAFYQQYTTLCYTSSAIRRLLSGGFSMLDLSLGQGMDALGTLAYYGLTDPTQWLGALFSGRGLEIYYHVLIFVYIYLSGLFFGMYARMTVLKREARPWIVAMAAMIFAFCGYQTIGVIKNPYYAAGGLYLALMLIAVERILDGRRWRTMVWIALLMLISNFYLAFQTTLLVATYALIRLLARLRSRGLRESVKDGMVLAGSCLLGFLMGMAVLLPVALNFLASSRVDVSSGYTASMLHYPAGYYLKLLALFCAPYDYAGYWSLQSFCPLALLGLMLLFAPAGQRDLAARDGVRRQLRIAVALSFAFLCVPLAGKVFNGMGYVTNRWCYGHALAVCAATAWALPRMLSPDFAGRRKLAAAGLVWALLMVGYAVLARRIPGFKGGGNAVAVHDYGESTKNFAAELGALALAGASLCILALDGRLRTSPERAVRTLAILTSVCCLAYSVGYGVVAATSDEFMRANVDRSVKAQTGAAAQRIEDDGFWRADTGLSADAHAPLLGYRGTGYYWSMIPEWVANHYIALEQGSMRWTFRLEGLGGDRYLNDLASVGYVLRSVRKNVQIVPENCERMFMAETAGKPVEVYKNADALPLGYMFDRTMGEAAYGTLNPVEKREALISCAVVEDGLALDLPSLERELPVEHLEWTLASADGAEIDGNVIRARKGGVLTLRFEGKPDSDTYLRLKGTRLVATSDDTDVRLYTRTEAGINSLYLILPDGVFNYGQQGACASLGYSAEGFTECSLGFRDDALIEFEDLEILSAPAGFARDAVEEIRGRGTWSAQVTQDRAEGKIHAETAGVMQIALPYSAGWSAWVDGQPAEIFRCGGMYMGIQLDAGEHLVALRYETPGLRAGAWISAAALILFALINAGQLLRRRERGD